MSRRAAVAVLGAASAVLVVGGFCALAGIVTLEMTFANPTDFEPGADPGFLERQRLMQLAQVLWRSTPWLLFAAYLPAIGALVLAAVPSRNPRVPAETGT